MNKDEFVILCLKIMGVYFLLMGFINLPHLLKSLFEPKEMMWSFFVSPLLFFICGAILFFFAKYFSKFIICVDTKSEGPVNLSASSNTSRIALQILEDNHDPAPPPGHRTGIPNCVKFQAV